MAFNWNFAKPSEQLFLGKHFCLNISQRITFFTNTIGFTFLWDQSDHQKEFFMMKLSVKHGATERCTDCLKKKLFYSIVCSVSSLSTGWRLYHRLNMKLEFTLTIQGFGDMIYSGITKYCALLFTLTIQQLGPMVYGLSKFKLPHRHHGDTLF